jgi:acetyltransferase-like isoleucine patch superfamily enzyme
MSETKRLEPARRSVRQIFQGLIRSHFWGMDIAPSAWIAPTALIDRTWPRGVHIGEGCVVDEEAVVLTHDMTRGLYLDTVIGARTVIGVRAIVLPGVTIGADCTVEPGTLVTKDVPAGSRVMGNPASIVTRDAAEPD